MTPHPQSSRTVRPWSFTLGALALLALTACGDKSPPAPSSAPPPAPARAAVRAPLAPPPPAAPARPELTPAQKLNQYVACYNRVDSRGHDAWRRYSQWVTDMKAGPTGKERRVNGVYTLSESSVKGCAQLSELADTAPPLAELDKAAKPYAAAVTALASTLAEADKYYTRQDYKDDQMAKGKAMHPQLAQEFEAFKRASTQFSQALDAANDQRQSEQLVDLEKTEGRKFNYWHTATMVNAKRLTQLVSEEAFDLEQASAALKAYEDAAQGLTDFTRQAPKNELPLAHSSMDSYVEAVLVAAKQRVRRVRDKTPYQTGERMNIANGSGWMVPGSPDDVVRKYNELVGASNRLR